MHQTLSVEKKESGLMIVTLDRPEVYNAINTQMMHDLISVFEPLVQRPGDIRCIVLTGAGDKAFCTGGDLKERNSMTDEQWFDQHLVGQRAVAAITDCSVPIICAVNGLAYAGGLELTLAADFTYAVSSARFALMEVGRGIMPGGGGVSVLPKIIGMRRAKEMVLTAVPVDAWTALAWGLINKVCDEGQLMNDALRAAQAICHNAPLAIKQAKKAITLSGDVDRHSSNSFALEAYHRLILSDDRLEGIRAFNEKRRPIFVGR